MRVSTLSWRNLPSDSTCAALATITPRTTHLLPACRPQLCLRVLGEDDQFRVVNPVYGEPEWPGKPMAWPLDSVVEFFEQAHFCSEQIGKALDAPALLPNLGMVSWLKTFSKAYTVPDGNCWLGALLTCVSPSTLGHVTLSMASTTTVVPALRRFQSLGCWEADLQQLAATSN